ncbi:MAG: serine/threonine-protein kinase [Planctomycetota bacterium]
MSTLPPPPWPRRFGRFELLREIARGAMGVVFEATQLDLARRVALKLLPATHALDPNRVAAFAQEVRAAARVRHPGLVEVFDGGVHEDQPYLAMELVAGRSLAERLREDGVLAPLEAARVVAEVARAVHALHEGGVVHRDLKPANVLIDAAGRARVTDFGLALLAGAGLGQEDGVVGTPGCMAPEQIDARVGEVGPRSDVWAMGSLLFRLLTSEPPHLAATPIELLLAAADRPARTLRSVLPKAPPELDAVVRRCLALDPAERFATAAELAEELERYQRAEGLTLRLPGPWARFHNWRRTHLALAIHLLAIPLLWGVALLDHVVWRVTDAEFFARISGIAAASVAVSLLCDRLQGGARGAWPVAVWVGADAVALAAVAAWGDGPGSAVVRAFPVLIAASALWLRRDVVLLATAACTLAYLALVFHAEWHATAWRQPSATYVMTATSFALLGWIGARLIARVRRVLAFAARRR